jgi:hypothetical protein
MRNSIQRHNAIMGVSCDAPQHLGIDSIVIRTKDVKMVAQGAWEKNGKTMLPSTLLLFWYTRRE